MKRLIPIVLATFALAAPAAASAASQPAVRGVNVGIVGPSTTSDEVQQKVADAAALGATTMRVTVIWARYEPSPGQLDPTAMARFDELVRSANAKGIKPLIDAYGTPCWASSSSDAASDCGASSVPVAPPKDPADYGRFAAKLIAPYADGIAGFEVWNEPDLEGNTYWDAPDEAASYADLLKASYPIIKAAAPNVPVLGGSLVGSGGQFLNALYDHGIKGSYDGIAVHFYGGIFDALTDFRSKQKKAGDTSPLWLTEFGWTTCEQAGPDHKLKDQFCVDPSFQATDFLDVFRVFPKYSYVKAAVVYQQQDGTDGSAANFGLLTTGGTRKPAWTAVQKGLAGKAGKPQAPTLKVKKRKASGTVPAGGIVVINVFNAKGIFAGSAGIAGDRNNRYSAKLPKKTGKGWTVEARQPATGRSVKKHVK